MKENLFQPLNNNAFYRFVTWGYSYFSRDESHPFIPIFFVKMIGNDDFPSLHLGTTGVKNFHLTNKPYNMR